MRFSKGSAAAVIAVSLMLHSTAFAADTDAPEKQGSLYLQCDGQPNNMTGGETAARLLGAVTLLGLFAPQPEQADGSKRKFGTNGIEACTALIDGDKREGNPARRVHLILGRAIHQIEAKNYDAAIADAKLAQSEAEAAGLMADPYYVRSEGRAPYNIQAAALYRQGHPDEARAMALTAMDSLAPSLFGLLSAPGYLVDDLRAPSDDEIRYISARTHDAAVLAPMEADRLEEFGRFADAAKVRDAVIDLSEVDGSKLHSSLWLAQDAVSHELAGDRAKAAERAAAAKANFEKRRADGNPESSEAEFVEVMDLYGILNTAANGDMKTARRLFAARSAWVATSFGSVVETARRLRVGAAPDELIGGLAHDPDAMWKDRLDTQRAEILGRDSDNKTLFGLIPGWVQRGTYEGLSKQVWQVDKSKLLLKRKAGDDSSKRETLFLFGQPTSVTLQAYMLHGALLAQSRGQQGFVMMPVFTKEIVAAWIITGNRGDPGLDDAVFNSADDVVAKLSPIIPSPSVLAARRNLR